ncbi:MAG: hypothetical protein K6G69_10365 [Lachnospiraceae bacterium]|nr:hypothetical protein [Lachnospiraceae bacterium]
MTVIGIIFILLLPYATGIIWNVITRQKETNQIETYLIGFFSIFLIQGVLFALYNFMGMPYEKVCNILTYVTYALMGLGVVGGIICRKEIAADFKKVTFRKDERIMAILMILVIALVVLRVVLLFGYERNDIMLETVRINVMTSTVNTYNPLTGRMYELGLINSKKLISLPLFYTYWCMTYGIEARVLLYIVITLQTVMCMFFACECAMEGILRSNKKMYTCMMFVGVMLLSGDYFEGALGYKVLWNGYLGESIIAAVIIPYTINLIMDFYRLERGDYGDKKWGKRIVRVIRLLITMSCSVFITGIPKGLLLIALCLAAIIVCTTLRFGKEER